LKLTDTSRLDYWNGSWKIIDIFTVLTVEKGRTTLLKLRPSVLEELTLEDCPGLAERLARQPRVVGTKRLGQPLEVVSPVKKAARTENNPTISVAGAAIANAAIIVIDDDEPMPPVISDPPPTPSTSTVPLDSASTSSITGSSVVQQPAKKLKSSRRVAREWILDCPLSVWQAGWLKIHRMIDNDKRNTTEASAFPVVFNRPYVKATVSKYKGKFKNLPGDVRDLYLSLGDIPSASFQHALAAADRPRASPDDSGNNPPPIASSSANAELTASNAVPPPAITPPLAPVPQSLPTPQNPPSPILQPLLSTPRNVAPHLRLPGSGYEDPLRNLDLESPLKPSAVNRGDVDLMELGLDPDIYANMLLSQPCIIHSQAQFGLCPFCDVPYVAAPSAKLQRMLSDAEENSVSSPNSANPNHRQVNSFLISSQYCLQHRREGPVLLLARANGWPEDISYGDLRNTVMKLKPELGDVLESLDDSELFHEALDRDSSQTPFSYSTG
jgi:hypothetical protein